MPSFCCRRGISAATTFSLLTVLETAVFAEPSAAPEPAVPTAAQAADGAVSLPPIEVQSPETGPSLIEAPLNSNTLTSQQISNWRRQTNDTARLLESVAGTSVYSAGGVSSIPVIQGQADDRLNTLVNGMPIPSACSNHMNPAMSYIDPTNVGTFSTINGITPVSKGGDSIGGTVVVDSPAPVFAAPGETFRFAGETAAFYRSINDNYAASIGNTTIANDTYSLSYSGAFTTAANYRGGGDDGKLRSTEYRAFNNTLSGAARGSSDQFSLQLGQQYIPYQGFPNQYMDMTENLSYVANGGYERSFSWGELTARTFFQSVDHEMNFLNDKGGTDGGKGCMAM